MTLTGDVIWTHVFDSQKLDFAWSIAVHQTGIYVGGEVARDAVIGKLDFDGSLSAVATIPCCPPEPAPAPAPETAVARAPKARVPFAKALPKLPVRMAMAFAVLPW